jgi:hypothetical protein
VDLLRPRQARYQAALRPDMLVRNEYKGLPNFFLVSTHRRTSNCAKSLPEKVYRTIALPELCGISFP